MYISEDTINQIKNQVNIVEIIGEFVPLKRTGQNYKALCPFHTEKTPSFIVNPQKGIFHCFGCGVGGNVFNFLMKFKGVGFPDAVRLLGERVGVHIKTDGERGEKKSKADILYAINKTATSFFISNLLSEKGGQALKYLKIRKIDSTTTKAFNLGYSLNSWDEYYTILVDSVAAGTNEYIDSVPLDGVRYYYWLQTVGKGEEPPTDAFSVTGTVADQEGNPIEGVLLRLYNASESVDMYTISGSDGGYGFYDVPPGEYYLVAKRDDYQIFSKTVTVE